MPFDFDDESSPPPAQMSSPVLCVRAKIRVADLTAERGGHRFGGPLALEIRGALPATAPLHRVVTLALADPRVGFSLRGVTELPLVYGFVFDGCVMKYRVVSNDVIEILEIDPEAPSDDWPYERYPSGFPERRFEWIDDGAIDPETGIAVIVPTSAAYGVSLWGEFGDAEQIQVIFEIDPRTRVVSAYNVCT